MRGDVRDQALLERVLGEYEIDTVIHLAAQTIVGIANRNPVSTFETNVAGIFVAGGVISGKDTAPIFIENGRFHGEKIVEVISARR